jgi:tripartite-type tricarboxylate transporter receptor subunit TctC
MGVVGPAKLPKEIAQRLNKELNELVAEPVTVERIHALGSEPKTGTPEDFARRISADIDRWNKVIDEAKIERI